jgi:hypothetical protein
MVCLKVHIGISNPVVRAFGSAPASISTFTTSGPFGK